MSKHAYTYLALGDSYTVGEGVALFESFPYQVVHMLRGRGIHMHAPEIVAKTGWTTFELAEYVLHTTLNTAYDLVSLAIGVNNQYRGLSVKEYETDFEFLLKKAIHFAGEHPGNVLVLSIPDWGVTPFAHGRNTKKIAEEITGFNAANKIITERHMAKYVDTAKVFRDAAINEKLLASDKLHPSGLEYTKWASAIVKIVFPLISAAIK